jgi:TolB-like protein
MMVSTAAALSSTKRTSLSFSVVGSGVNEKLIVENIPEAEIRSQLSLILQSELFAQSDRLGRFLRFSVEQALAGNAHILKEYVIGTEVYDRKPPYHPSQDSIVRTEARRLRAKLKEYYESSGKDDPIFIYLRPGAYVPVFRRNERPDGSSTSNLATASGGLLSEGDGVSLAVLPFTDLSGQPLSSVCAQGLSDELIHALVRSEGINVASASSVAKFATTPRDIPSLARELGVQFLIEGSVRGENNRLRITSSVLNADGFQLNSQRFETEVTSDSIFQIQELIARAFISRARPEQSHIRHRKASAGALMMAVYPVIVQAEAQLDEGSAMDLQAALGKFQQAALVAPEFARIFCGISQCHVEMILRGIYPSSKALDEARSAALKAVELDSHMMESYSSLACVQVLEWKWREAELSFKRALQQGVHVGVARQYALFLAAMQRFDEASYYLEIAQRNDPFSYRQKIARAKFLFLSGRYEEGAKLALSPLLYGPVPIEAQLYVAFMNAYLGNKDEVRRIAESIRPSAGAQLPMMAGIAEALAMSGEEDRAKRLISDFKLLASPPPITRFRQALLALSLKDYSTALSLLRAAADTKEPELLWMAADPRIQPLRGEMVFKNILAELFSENEP